MNSKKKAKFRAEHEPEIILYEAATRELKKLLKGNPVPAEKKTIAKIRELSAPKNEEYEELSEIKKREKSLQEKVNNVRSIYENRIDRIQQKIEIRSWGDPASVFHSHINVYFDNSKYVLLHESGISSHKVMFPSFNPRILK